MNHSMRGGPLPGFLSPPPTLAEESASKAPLILLKLDDMRGDQEERWQRATSFLAERKIKAGIGIICSSLESGQPSYFERLRGLAATGYVEFWNHGYDHRTWKDGGDTLWEFRGTSLDHQAGHFKKSQHLAREKLGLTFTAFGAPFNAIDSTTVEILSTDPDIIVWLYGNPGHSAGKFVAVREAGVNIEEPVHRPNFAALKTGYEANPQAAYFVIQGHPPSWQENDFAEFVRIIDFLAEKNTCFVFPSELPAVLKSTPN